MVSKYRPYSVQELLNMIGDKRYHSPLINELCVRLEGYIGLEEQDEQPETGEVVVITCPVCEANIPVQPIFYK